MGRHRGKPHHRGSACVAATPLFIVRRRALLAIAALIPLSMAAVQIAYLAFLPPTGLLLLDAVVLFVAGELGVLISRAQRRTSRQ